MRPADIVRLVTTGSPAVSPDGATVACTVTRIDADANRYRADIWLVAADGSAPPRRLTASDGSDSGPVWAPDGARLAFVRTVKGDGATTRSSVLVVPVDGPGEAVTIVEGPEPMGGLDWSPDGTHLVWAVRVRDARYGERDAVDEAAQPPRRIETLLTRVDDTGWIVDRPTQVVVGRVDGTEPPRQVTTGRFEHAGPRWSPDGRHLVFSAARHATWDLDQAVDLWLAPVDPAPDGAAPLRRLTATDLSWSNPAWSPDGTRIAALVSDERAGFRNTRVGVLAIDEESGEGSGPAGWRDITDGVDRPFAPYPGARPPVWLDDRHVLASCEDRGRVTVVRLAAAGGEAPLEVAGGLRMVLGFDAAGATLAMVSTTATELPELSTATIDPAGAGPEQRITSVGAAFHRACPSLPVERTSVPSPAGDDIDVWIVRPPGFGEGDRGDDDGRWPLLLQIHGGPATQHGERWFDEWQYLASAGFVVLGANPHGSSGRGEAWARSLRSPLADLDPGTGWGGIDADDLLAVLDAILERLPAVDPARVGVLGGSYGGFMTSLLMGRTDRFAAGCTERAVNNLLSEEWSADIGGFFGPELGVSHLERPDEYLRMSPVAHVAGIDRPVQILHSEGDLRCPPEQADALFVALRLLGRSDLVEYWRFPAEGHELSRSGSPTHRVQRGDLVVDFFTRHLGAGRR